MNIQQAYERLSSIKRRRKNRNTMQQTEDDREEYWKLILAQSEIKIRIDEALLERGQIFSECDSLRMNMTRFLFPLSINIYFFTKRNEFKNDAHKGSNFQKGRIFVFGLNLQEALVQIRLNITWTSSKASQAWTEPAIRNQIKSLTFFLKLFVKLTYQRPRFADLHSWTPRCLPSPFYGLRTVIRVW